MFGFRYLFCDTVLPYHQQAIGTDWNELGPGLQLLLNSLVKLSASAFFLAGISSIALLAIPFRKGEVWAKWSIAIIQISFLCFALFTPINVAVKTDASTPWPFSLATLIMGIVAFLLSGISRREI